jgi:uncharacterized peroxidase-related enzyme
VKRDYRKARLDRPTRALADYAAKLTRSPGRMARSDVEKLRRAGFSDAAILDAAEIAGYFNYINRVADGLGIDLEDFMKSPIKRRPAPVQ